MPKRLLHYLLCAVLLLFSVFSLHPVAAAQADSVLRIVKQPENIRRGASFSLVLSPAQRTLSAFVLFVDYDPADIVQARAAMAGAHLYTSEQDGRLTVVCAAKQGHSLSETGTLTLTFRTSEETLSETLPLRLTVADAASDQAQSLLDAPEIHAPEIPFLPDPAADSSLLSLTPPVGTLVPAFNPEIFHYTLEVPFSSASLVFDAVPADGATVRVNRKNLGSGGSTVDFSFTVTAEDGVTQSVYTVSVTRLAKESAATAGSTSSSGGISPSGGNSTSGSKPADTEKNTNVSESSTVAAVTGAIVSSGAVDTVYVSSTGAPYDVRADRFETMAIVLISVGAGMGFVVLIQRFGKTTHNDEKDK